MLIKDTKPLLPPTFGGKHNHKKLSDDCRCGSGRLNVVSTSTDV